MRHTRLTKEDVYAWLIVLGVVILAYMLVSSCKFHDPRVYAGVFGAEMDGDAARGGATIFGGEMAGAFVAGGISVGKDESQENFREQRAVQRDMAMTLAKLEQHEKKSVTLQEEQNRHLGGFMESWGPTGAIGAALIAAAFALKKKAEA